MDVAEAYLTTDLTMQERLRLINRDPEAVMRAISYDKNVDDSIEQIRHLHFAKNKSAEEIAAYFLPSPYEMDPAEYMEHKKELMRYINKVIAASS